MLIDIKNRLKKTFSKQIKNKQTKTFFKFLKNSHGTVSYNLSFISKNICFIKFKRYNFEQLLR